MRENYGVFAYSLPALKELFVELAGARQLFVEQKLQSEFFEDYFEELNAQTIVVEYDYVDHDYLEDYAGYYVKCFNPPRAHCARLHFFATQFNRGSFTRFLNGSTDRKRFLEQKLQGETNYIGFIVVKPLPETFIGRTCLRTYSEDATGRKYPALRDYEANLFGVSLRVRTLAFEEQDKEVAQCGTSAMWSVLQGTAIKFGHAVPTPVEITKNALAVHARQSRTFPTTDGLTIEQLADAVRKMHLEPYCADVSRREILQTEAYAYLRAGIPALMSVTLWDTLDPAGKSMQHTDKSGTLFNDVAVQAFGDGDSGHAIALSGFHLADVPATPYGQTGILLTATRIDKFYAHDDQVGPFSKMPMSAHGVMLSAKIGDQVYKTPFMETSWKGKARIRGSVRAVPGMLLVPLYPKMRIPLKIALEATVLFDVLVEYLRSIKMVPGLKSRIEWDIHLTTASELKADPDLVIGLGSEERRRLLTSSMPRYIWRAKGLDNGLPFVELLFDATDIVQGCFFLRAIEHAPGALTQFRAVIGVGGLSGAGLNIVEWFKAN